MKMPVISRLGLPTALRAGAITFACGSALASLLAGCSTESDDDWTNDAGGATAETAIELVQSNITLRTVVVPRFVGATNNGGSTVVATATAAQAWETFALDDINGGTLNSGDTVTIRTGAGQYFRAVNGGGAALDATATAARGWETFTIVKASGSGAIKNGDAVGFRTSTGHYLRAVNGGGAAIDTLGAALSTWEQFTLGGLSSAPTGDPTCSTGIAADGVCCPASCGACGGSGCGSRPGGTSACCAGPIRTAGASCSGSLPPCVLSTNGSGGSTGSGGSSSGGSTSTPSRPPYQSTLSNGQGAVVPFAEYEAETMSTNGSKLGPTRTFGQIAAEASGRQAVRLDATGEYVQFQNAYAANSIVVRYSIPDSGANYWTTLGVYVNGSLRTRLNLTSRYSWTYGSEYQFNSPDQDNPALGSPHHFFDEARALIGDIPVGATVTLRKDSGDSASRYDIDLVDLEQVGAPLAQPAGFLSLTNDCGAVANDGRDDSAAIQSCMDRARGERRGVYVPQGTFHSFSRVISVAGVTVRGAGMWYSTVEGFNASFDCWADGCKYQDFRINGDSIRRLDDSPETAFRGNGQSNSVVERMWVEHVKAGMFSSPNSTNIVVRDSRFRSLFADGVNFWAGTSNSLCENNHMRGTGDDSFAIWADSLHSGTVNANNVIRHNWIQAPWKANCIGLYGGNSTRIEDNVCADTVQYPGILLARQFDSHPFQGTTRIDRNTLVRAGGWTYNQEHGALKIHADRGDIWGVAVNDLDIQQPSYFGVHVQGTAQIGGTTLTNVRIGQPASGGFFLNWGARGSLTATSVVASGSPLGVRNDAGSAFNLIRGSGNSGW